MRGVFVRGFSWWNCQGVGTGFWFRFLSFLLMRVRERERTKVSTQRKSVFFVRCFYSRSRRRRCHKRERSNARIPKERFPRFWRLKNAPQNDNNISKVFSPQCTSPTPVSFGLASLTFPEDALLCLRSEYASSSSFFGRCFAS